ncbi:MAG: outer membrane protein assembly factor BamD [Sphingobacteriales bacterium]|nr:MAG: outer membrane protein assembly factor BamD [Sphingobacteriales bacterium]
MGYPFFRSLLPALALLLLASCNPYEKVLKSNDLSFKLTKANEYYDAKKYQQANEIYQQLIPVMKGTRSFEPLVLRYAWSFYNMKDYLQASYWFKNFVDYFPASKEAEECEYMQALCLYKESPKSSLEQTNTIKAMESMQSFINRYPTSKHLTEANTMIDEGRSKLEAKDASASDLYFKIRQYRAASVAFKSLLRSYPESARADYYQFMIVRSLYLYARESVAEKQEERYASAVTAYREMADLYPQSTYLTEAKRFSELSDDSINDLRKQKS